jgi:hypothetical protein
MTMLALLYMRAHVAVGEPSEYQSLSPAPAPSLSILRRAALAWPSSEISIRRFFLKPPLRTKSVGTKVSEAEFALLEERARGPGCVWRSGFGRRCWPRRWNRARVAYALESDTTKAKVAYHEGEGCSSPLIYLTIYRCVGQLLALSEHRLLSGNALC